MLHIVRLLEKRFPAHAAFVLPALLALAALGLVAGMALLWMQGAR